MTLPLPLQFLAAWLAVWLGRVLQEQVDFLKAENRLLREKLGGKRIRLTDAERRRLATLGKKLGRKGLAAVATIAIPVLAGLTVPAHIIAAADDPVIDVGHLDTLARPNCLSVEVTRDGGHCGYIQSCRLDGWIDERIAQLLRC